jgi:hypothetical protein
MRPQSAGSPHCGYACECERTALSRARCERKCRSPLVGAPYPTRAAMQSPLISAPCATTPFTPTPSAGRWPGWHHHRITWPAWLPSPTWGHARSRRDRHCPVPTRLAVVPIPQVAKRPQDSRLDSHSTVSYAGPGGKTSISQSNHAIGSFPSDHRSTAMCRAQLHSQS